jgi:hypothetical protein
VVAQFVVDEIGHGNQTSYRGRREIPHLFADPWNPPHPAAGENKLLSQCLHTLRWLACGMREPRLMRNFALFFCLNAVAWCGANPAGWVPARWDGGPLEVARRNPDAKVREVIAKWYEPATLDLLKGTPINCLLVTFSTGKETDAEVAQRRLVKEYARAAHERGLAVLGIVYPGAESTALATAADEARLDGLVLEGEFPADFSSKLETALHAKNSSAVVIPILSDAAPARTSKAALVAVQGVRPSARNLADMGIRAGASAEPWIESNIWLVESLRPGNEWRPVWVNQEPNPSSEGDYIRCVADGAVGGGRWIVALDDDLRARLFRKDAGALGTWRRMAAYLQFAEDHAEWRMFAPYGNLGIIIDPASKNPDVAEEYLNLITRRHVPYRLIQRAELSAQTLASFQAVLAADLAPATQAERTLLNDFAEKGGLVVTGPSWGGAPKDDPYAEVPLGKGRVAVYKDAPPDAESVSKDLQDLLPPEVIGLRVFNVPTAITSASTSGDGGRVLIQLLNYAGRPIERTTVRFKGVFKRARLYTPEHAPIDLTPAKTANGMTELLIPEVAAWGAVLLDERN